MTYRTSLPLHPTEDDKPKTKRQEKKILKSKAKATGTPYTKFTKKRKDTPGIKVARAGVKSIAGGMKTVAASAMAGMATNKKAFAATAAAGGLAALAGAGAVLTGIGISSLKRNKPTAKPVTKKNTRKNIKKTRHVTPTGVTRTKTKTYKKR